MMENGMTANNELSSPEKTKTEYRFKVWNELENKDLVRFPRPCKGRIPNFVDSLLAAEKLTSEDVFKEAKVILVNVDKPQEPVRFAILEAGKTLLVPLARLEDGLVIEVCPPPDANRKDLTYACRRREIQQNGKSITLEDKIHIDLIVLGSVAVSKEGHHIGKGGGFSDMEYAILASTGAVTKDTLIVTTVHDEQVFDTLPHRLFEPFDVPVDLIVTPTQIITVSPRLPRPEKILWNSVTNRRLQQFPLLNTLRSKEIENGNDCTLNEVDSGSDNRTRPYYRPNYRRNLFQQRSHGEHSESDTQRESPAKDRRRPTRTFRRQRQFDGSKDAAGEKEKGPSKRFNKAESKVNGENKENQPQKPFKKQRPFYKRRVPLDFSVKVGNIHSSCRVRDLKAALIEKGVRPRAIVWKGARGYALLLFAKMNTEPEQPTAVDDVIASLQGLKVKYESEDVVSEAVLSIEPAKPISRIEDAGVTSV